ncbi:hypothetical protein [Paenibacillus sp. W2I17]|uniref:hypothetical protein n=1 Tax=Paenibacillus sp. W2I17 TaxID=3042311 RepID=UPI0027888431|nr:hypothetical protein [Paenibacillus sp. W2I17]MDQ0660056.1 hypothetical protein [Paenibacillus sp. W2I17]
MSSKTFKSKIFWLSFLLVLTSLIFNIASIKNILIDVYQWHAVQPETVQGGIELIFFFLIIYFFIVLSSEKPYLKYAPLLAIVIYLQFHQVLLPAALATLYFEIIISLGLFILTFAKVRYSAYSLKLYFVAFLVGFVCWSVLAIILSGIGVGRINDLILLTLFLAVLSLFKRTTPMFVYVYNKGLSFNRLNAMGFTFVIILLMTQFAKTNRALDYDSLWYGLRPQEVLIGDHSFFDNLGLTMVVHYYPKLFELFALPLSGLGDYSFILSVNILLFAFILLVIFKFTKDITNNNSYSVLATVILGSTPAIANMASTAKTDIFSSLFILGAAYSLWLWNKERTTWSFLISMCAALLACGGKITSLMYVPLLFLGYGLAYIINLRADPERSFFEKFEYTKRSILLLLGSVFVFLGITFRTYKLTGYPFYPILKSFWEKIGFKGEYPFTDSSQDFILSDQKNILYHWFKILFDPAGYNHYVMVWPSNMYLFFWIFSIVLVIAFRKLITRSSCFLLIAFLPISISAVYNIMSFPQGGDGNYYIPVILFAGISFIGLISSFDIKLKKVIVFCLILFIPVQSYVMMVSHFSWSWGTSKFSANLLKTNFETYDSKLQFFQNEGLLEIEKELELRGEDNNCIGFLHYDGQEQILNQLSCRYEDVPHMNSRYGNSNLFSSFENFKKYLLWANVKFIIVPKTHIEGFDQVESVITELENTGKTKRVDSSDFYLLEIDRKDIHSLSGMKDSFSEASLLKGWYPKENNYRWISKEAIGNFQSGEEGRLTIAGKVPDVLENIELSIQVNDYKFPVQKLNEGEFTIQLNNHIPINSKVRIKIEVNKSFVPEEMGLNKDTRELGIVITDITLK